MQVIKRIFSHQLVRGTTFVFAGSFAVNVFNYLFHLITGRLLGPENYALVASLLSLSYVIGFPSSIINMVTSRKVAELSAKKDIKGIHGIVRVLFRLLSFASIFFVLLFFVVQYRIASFLNIENPNLVFLLGISLIFSFFSTVTLATLQGMLRFMNYAIITAFGGLFKDVFVLMALLLGYGVLGVAWALVAISVTVMILSFIPLWGIFSVPVKRHTVRWKSIGNTLWISSAFLGMGLIINLDVLLVKHFFTAYDAGLYAALATIGKIVLFLSSPIALVLLPVSTQKNTQGHSSHKELLLALSFILILSMGVIGVYVVFPQLVVTLLYGEKYIKIAPLLWVIGVYFLLYNISYLYISYFISLKKNVILITPLIISVSQIALLYRYHESFIEVLSVLIGTGTILVLLFFGYERKYATRQ